MYTRRNIRWSVIFSFAWRQVLVFGIWAVAVVFAFTQLQSLGIDCSVPIAPLGTIGVAVAFYIGFKNNQSYDRSWEARKIWGGIVNVSRSWANQVLTFVSNRERDEPLSADELREVQRTLIYRQLAWINALRFQLRRKTPFGFEPKGSARRYMQLTDVEALKAQIAALLPDEELSVACSRLNSAAQILRLQSEHVRQTLEEQLIEEFRLIAMMELVTEMYALQGKCERIKNTPFPRQYAYFSSIFTWIFIVLLPFGIVGEFAEQGSPIVWLTVPFSVVVSWIFYTMEAVGDASEDPFENFINDVPMTTLCRTIEIDLRQMLGEQDVPEPMQPQADILM